MRQSNMKPVEVTQEVLDRFKAIPTATVYNAVRAFGSEYCVCEGINNLTPFVPGEDRFAAREVT